MSRGHYTHFIFDVDGTLEDTESAVIKAYQELTQIFRVGTYSNEYVRKNCFIVPPPEGCKNLGITDEEHLKVALRYLNESVYRDPSVKLFPGILPMLQALQQRRIGMAICTARTPDEFVYDQLFQMIRPFFSELMHSEYAARPKPAPDAVLDYLAKYRLQKEQVLFVGDSVSDYGCAHAAGVDFALAQWSSCADRSLPADYRLMEPEEILKLS